MNLSQKWRRENLKYVYAGYAHNINQISDTFELQELLYLEGSIFRWWDNSTNNIALLIIYIYI